MTKKKSVINGLEADKIIIDDKMADPSKQEIREIEQKAIKAIFDKEHTDIDPQLARKLSCNRDYK